LVCEAAEPYVIVTYEMLEYSDVKNYHVDGQHPGRDASDRPAGTIGKTSVQPRQPCLCHLEVGQWLIQNSEQPGPAIVNNCKPAS